MLRSYRDGQTPLSGATWADDGSGHYAMSARGRKPTCFAVTVDCRRIEMTLMPSKSRALDPIPPRIERGEKGNVKSWNFSIPFGQWESPQAPLKSFHLFLCLMLTELFTLPVFGTSYSPRLKRFIISFWYVVCLDSTVLFEHFLSIQQSITKSWIIWSYCLRLIALDKTRLQSFLLGSKDSVLASLLHLAPLISSSLWRTQSSGGERLFKFVTFSWVFCSLAFLLLCFPSLEAAFLGIQSLSGHLPWWFCGFFEDKVGSSFSLFSPVVLGRFLS